MCVKRLEEQLVRRPSNELQNLTVRQDTGIVVSATAAGETYLIIDG